MRFHPFPRARSQQWAMLGALSVLAAVSGWGCPGSSAVSNGTAISGAEFAYVANRADNTVSAYTVDATAGTLKAIGTTKAGNDPVKIEAVSLGAKSNYVYVLNFSDNTISQFAINANGTLAPLNPATVAIGAEGTDMALSADGSAYAGFSSGSAAASDKREFRLYVGTKSNFMRVFGINADGTLVIKNDVHLQAGPNAVGVKNSGPDYTIYNGNQRVAPHDLDKSIVVLSAGATTAQQYTPVPLAQGGVTSASNLTLPTGVSVVTGEVAAGTSATLAVGGDGTRHHVSFFKQSLPDNVLAQGSPFTTFDTVDNPISIATAGIYRINENQVTFTKECIYAATDNNGSIYQFDADGSPLTSDSIEGTSVPPLQMNDSSLMLKAYRGRMYVVKGGHNQVTSYAIKNEDVNSGQLPASDNGRLLESTAQSTPTGIHPSAITFLNTSSNGGAVQTTIH